MMNTSSAYRTLPGSRTCAANRRRAFTFVEILATMTILAIVLPPVMRGISLCLATAGSARDVAVATSLAQAKLDELIVTGQWEQAEVAGDFGADAPQFRWAAQLADYEGTELRELSVDVKWSRYGRDRSVRLTTLVYTGLDEEAGVDG